MARNLKKENLIKLSQIKTSNGFKIDLGNYMYNPSYSHDYPSLVKMTSETETKKYYTSITYFKHYDKSGEYILETYSHKKDDNNSWVIVTDSQRTELESNNRFNLKHLIELAEQIKEQIKEQEQELAVAAR